MEPLSLIDLIEISKLYKSQTYLMILILLQLSNKRNQDSHKKSIKKIHSNNKVWVLIRTNYLKLKSKYRMILELTLHTIRVQNGKCLMHQQLQAREHQSIALFKMIVPYIWKYIHIKDS